MCVCVCVCVFVRRGVAVEEGYVDRHTIMIITWSVI